MCHHSGFPDVGLAGILLLRPATDPVLALLIATAVAMAVSYIGLKFGVFGRPPN